MGTVTQSISVSLANAVTLSGVSTIPSLKIALSPATGLFTGSVIPPGATVAKPIYGVLLQAGPSSRGRGFFLNGIMPGGVILR